METTSNEHTYDFILKRSLETKTSTLGKLLTKDEKFLCYILEDGYNPIKIPEVTRIPGGLYILKLITSGDHHKRYLKKYGKDFHKGMIEITNVPNYTSILFHIGNTVLDTRGCLISGLGYGMDSKKENYIISGGTSTKAYLKVYPIIRDLILTKNEVKLWIPGR